MNKVKLKSMIKRGMQLTGRNLWDMAPHHIQNILRPMYHHQKLMNAKNKIKDEALLNMRSKRFTRQIDEYWIEHYGKRIDPLWHHIYANFTGVEDVRFIPQDVWSSELHSIFNDPNYRDTTYGDKNLYDKLFNTANTPQTIYKKTRGKYFDADHNEISAKDAESLILINNKDKIIKPSLGGGGARVFEINIQKGKLLINNEEKKLKQIEDKIGSKNNVRLADNYIVQNKVIQHHILSKPHKYSLNTIRVISFRWNFDIKVLLHFAKFGNNKNIIDSGSSGAIFCGIHGNGKFYDHGVDIHFKKYDLHPFSSVQFAKFDFLPSYKKMVDMVKSEHKKALHMDFAAWDIAIQENGLPCLIEINSNPYVPIHQICCKKPLFGDLTKEVLQFAKSIRV